MRLLRIRREDYSLFQRVYQVPIQTLSFTKTNVYVSIVMIDLQTLLRNKLSKWLTNCSSFHQRIQPGQFVLLWKSYCMKMYNLCTICSEYIFFNINELKPTSNHLNITTYLFIYFTFPSSNYYYYTSSVFH